MEAETGKLYEVVSELQEDVMDHRDYMYTEELLGDCVESSATVVNHLRDRGYTARIAYGTVDVSHYRQWAWEELDVMTFDDVIQQFEKLDAEFLDRNGIVHYWAELPELDMYADLGCEHYDYYGDCAVAKRDDSPFDIYYKMDNVTEDEPLDHWQI